MLSPFKLTLFSNFLLEVYTAIINYAAGMETKGVEADVESAERFPRREPAVIQRLLWFMVVLALVRWSPSDVIHEVLFKRKLDNAQQMPRALINKRFLLQHLLRVISSSTPETFPVAEAVASEFAWTKIVQVRA